MPDLAGPADDGPLGHRGSCRSRRDRYPEGGGVRPRDPLSQEPDFNIPEPADPEPRQDGPERQAARDRTARRLDKAKAAGRMTPVTRVKPPNTARSDDDL